MLVTHRGKKAGKRQYFSPPIKPVLQEVKESFLHHVCHLCGGEEDWTGRIDREKKKSKVRKEVSRRLGYCQQSIPFIGSNHSISMLSAARFVINTCKFSDSFSKVRNGGCASCHSFRSCLDLHWSTRAHLTTFHSTAIPNRLQNTSEACGTTRAEQIIWFFPHSNSIRTGLKLQRRDLLCWMTVLTEEKNYPQRHTSRKSGCCHSCTRQSIGEMLSPNSCHLLYWMSSLSFSGQLRLTPIICQSREELHQSPQASGSSFLLGYLSKRFLQNLGRKKKSKELCHIGCKVRSMWVCYVDRYL